MPSVKTRPKTRQLRHLRLNGSKPWLVYGIRSFFSSLCSFVFSSFIEGGGIVSFKILKSFLFFFFWYCNWPISKNVVFCNRLYFFDNNSLFVANERHASLIKLWEENRELFLLFITDTICYPLLTRCRNFDSYQRDSYQSIGTRVTIKFRCPVKSR